MSVGSSAHPPVALCLGVFDGVHRGHSAIINAARRFISGISGGRVLVLTFDPHPSRVVRPSSPQPLLQSLPSRISVLQQSGCDQVTVIPFTSEFAHRSPEAFWALLQDAVPGRILGIFAGQNWRFGDGRAGDLAKLASLAAVQKSIVIGVPPVRHQGQVISSSWIRDLVKAAAFEDIPPLLGRAFELSGTVVAGRQLARQWGFPTANLYPNQECLPPNGVYAGWILIPDRQPAWSVCNLGTRPSLGAGEMRPLLEAHLFDFDEDLYNNSIRFVPIKKLRDEQQFSSLEALRNQIATDAAMAKICSGEMTSMRDGEWSASA
jgi:riboflavin kinase/FMN adenylyltransferase